MYWRILQTGIILRWIFYDEIASLECEQTNELDLHIKCQIFTNLPRQMSAVFFLQMLLFRTFVNTGSGVSCFLLMFYSHVVSKVYLTVNEQNVHEAK